MEVGVSCLQYTVFLAKTPKVSFREGYYWTRLHDNPRSVCLAEMHRRLWLRRKENSKAGSGDAEGSKAPLPAASSRSNPIVGSGASLKNPLEVGDPPNVKCTGC